MLPLPEAGNNKNGKKIGYLFQNEVVSVSTSLHTDFQKDRVRTKDRQQDEKRSSHRAGKEKAAQKPSVDFCCGFHSTMVPGSYQMMYSGHDSDAVITTKRLKPLDWWGP